MHGSSIVCCLLACLTSQQHASVSQGRICSDNCTCCHNEIGAADQTFYLVQSQCTDTGPTSPSTDPITSTAWRGSHGSANVEVTGMTRPDKIPARQNPCPTKSLRKQESNSGFAVLETDTLTTRPTRQSGSSNCSSMSTLRPQ